MSITSAADCIFCRIAAGESPCEEIWRNAATLAFMDINPANEGHFLMIAKAHFASVVEIPPELFAAAADAAKVARAVQDELRPGGLSLIQANGALAGQSAPHVHIHVLPRRADGNLPINWDRGRTDRAAGDPARIAAIASRLRARLAG